MVEWLRFIPHPTYGNYGGAKNKCTGPKCPLPIDAMDACFKRHDTCLEHADGYDDRQLCDNRLRKALRNVRVKGWYARLYRRGCLCIF